MRRGERWFICYHHSVSSLIRIDLKNQQEATKTNKGIVQIGDGINVEGGVISIAEVNTATKEQKGIVQIGDGLEINDSGVVSVAESAITSSNRFFNPFKDKWISVITDDYLDCPPFTVGYNEDINASKLVAKNSCKMLVHNFWYYKLITALGAKKGPIYVNPDLCFKTTMSDDDFNTMMDKIKMVKGTKYYDFDSARTLKTYEEDDRYPDVVIFALGSGSLWYTIFDETGERYPDESEWESSLNYLKEKIEENYNFLTIWLPDTGKYYGNDEEHAFYVMNDYIEPIYELNIPQFKIPLFQINFNSNDISNNYKALGSGEYIYKVYYWNANGNDKIAHMIYTKMLTSGFETIITDKRLYPYYDYDSKKLGTKIKSYITRATEYDSSNAPSINYMKDYTKLMLQKSNVTEPTDTDTDIENLKVPSVAYMTQQINAMGETVPLPDNVVKYDTTTKDTSLPGALSVSGDITLSWGGGLTTNGTIKTYGLEVTDRMKYTSGSFEFEATRVNVSQFVSCKGLVTGSNLKSDNETRLAAVEANLSATGIDTKINDAKTELQNSISELETKVSNTYTTPSQVDTKIKTAKDEISETYATKTELQTEINNNISASVNEVLANKGAMITNDAGVLLTPNVKLPITNYNTAQYVSFNSTSESVTKNITGIRMVASTPTTADIEMYAPAANNIYVKQYSSGPEIDTSAKNTITLLDGNGNTSFPGTVTVKGNEVATSSTIDNLKTEIANKYDTQISVSQKISNLNAVTYNQHGNISANSIYVEESDVGVSDFIGFRTRYTAKTVNLAGIKANKTASQTSPIELYTATSASSRAPIYARQYGEDPTGDPVNTLTLLDKNGNTNIPGTLSIGDKTLTSLIIDTIYPIGTVYVGKGLTSAPSVLFPNTTWETITGTDSQFSYYKRTK